MKDPSEPKIYYKGKFLKESEACLSPFNRGFSFGDGVFETLRVYSGKVFRLKNHIQRLLQGLSILDIVPGMDIAAIENSVKSLIDANGLTNASIKITAFREESPGLDPVSGSKACFLMTSSPFDFKRKSASEAGISVGVVSIRRNQTSPHVSIKSLNYLENLLGRREARDRGFDEALFLNNLEIVSEGSISNIFIVRKSRLMTPPAETGILEGITRAVVLEIAADYGINCCEKSFKMDAILTADEVFMTNSLMEIIPVHTFEDKRIGKTCPGRMTADLMNRYREKVDKELFV